MSDNAVDINNLHFAYDSRRRILRGIDISVPRGRLVALIGGSGSGKTTLLRNISGQVQADKGGIKVLGRDLSVLSKIGQRELNALRREMGVLFQHGGLFADLSAFENVAFPLREHWRLSSETLRDIVMLKLEGVGLRGSAKLFPSELSGGMQRRIGLARAVAMDPKLILYDEPFAGLDPISLAITARLIKELNAALGATSVIVTHEVYETFKIADYVHLMWDGRIIAQGTPADMRNSEREDVRQFVNAEIDGPLPHLPAPPLAEALGL